MPFGTSDWVNLAPFTTSRKTKFRVRLPNTEPVIAAQEMTPLVKQLLARIDNLLEALQRAQTAEIGQLRGGNCATQRPKDRPVKSVKMDETRTQAMTRAQRITVRRKTQTCRVPKGAARPHTCKSTKKSTSSPQRSPCPAMRASRLPGRGGAGADHQSPQHPLPTGGLAHP